MTAKGVRVGKKQPIRHCTALHMRQRIVGQQAGIDCDAATKAVKVPGAPGRADGEPDYTIWVPVGRRKTLQNPPASRVRAVQRLEMAQVENPFWLAEIKLAAGKPDRGQIWPGSSLPW